MVENFGGLPTEHTEHTKELEPGCPHLGAARLKVRFFCVFRVFRGQLGSIPGNPMKLGKWGQAVLCWFLICGVKKEGAGTGNGAKVKNRVPASFS